MVRTSSRRGEIILPFTPFVFAHVHGLGLLEKYDIRYIEEEELDNPEANPLYATAQSDLYAYYAPLFDLQPSHHDSVITHTMVSMLSKEDLFITKNDLRELLMEIGTDVVKIRFMALMVK